MEMINMINMIKMINEQFGHFRLNMIRIVLNLLNMLSIYKNHAPASCSQVPAGAAARLLQVPRSRPRRDGDVRAGAVD